MTNTASGIRKRIEELNKKLDNVESATKESGGLLFWRGKKIISVEQWQSLRKNGYEEVIRYIPNGFISHPLLGLASENGTGHGYKDERCDKWMDDYYDYLDYSRNPQLGKMYCGKCVLVNDKDQEVASTGLNLRKIIRRLMQLSLKNAKTSSPSPSSSSSARVIKQQPITIDYPCTVHNRFECPYRKSPKINDNLLVRIGKGLEVIHQALSYAHTLTHEIHDYTYRVDFEKDRLLETIGSSWYSGASNIRLEVEFRNLKQPKVSIESIVDIYKALTDRENLDILLEQYFEQRRDNPLDYGDNPNFDYVKRKEQNDVMRISIVDWFIQIKDYIRIEDLTNFYGLTLQEEEEKTKRRYLDQSTPIFVDHFNDICCECNKRGACILCINCDKWICADHWYNHKTIHHIRQ